MERHEKRKRKRNQRNAEKERKGKDGMERDEIREIMGKITAHVVINQQGAKKLITASRKHRYQ